MLRKVKVPPFSNLTTVLPFLGRVGNLPGAFSGSGEPSFAPQQRHEAPLGKITQLFRENRIGKFTN